MLFFLLYRILLHNMYNDFLFFFYLIANINLILWFKTKMKNVFSCNNNKKKFKKTDLSLTCSSWNHINCAMILFWNIFFFILVYCCSNRTKQILCLFLFYLLTTFSGSTLFMCGECTTDDVGIFSPSLALYMMAIVCDVLFFENGKKKKWWMLCKCLCTLLVPPYTNSITWIG